MPLHVSSICAHYQEVKIALYSLWYLHAYRCDDTRGFIMQFWPPDDEHMCSKHAEAWNKLILKQKFCASSWLITEINILSCAVSKSSKKIHRMCSYVSYVTFLVGCVVLSIKVNALLREWFQARPLNVNKVSSCPCHIYWSNSLDLSFIWLFLAVYYFLLYFSKTFM